MILSKHRYFRYMSYLLFVIRTMLTLLLSPLVKLKFTGLAAPCLRSAAFVMVSMGFFTAQAAWASSSQQGEGLAAVFTSTDYASSLLMVNAAWLDGGAESLPPAIRIDVTDPQTGMRSAIAVPISGYLRDGEHIEFIAIQAVDPYGRHSAVIEIKNPFFNPNLTKGNNTNADSVASCMNDSGGQGNEQNESKTAIEISSSNSHLRPFTPEGTGTVVDNVTDSDGGREFFTIFSADGNEFFLVIDRRRNSENVYFLNAVTEEDLMSLARSSGREITNEPDSGVSAIPMPPQSEPGTGETKSKEPTTPEPAPAENRPSAVSRIGSNLLFFLGIIAVAGGIGYYIKFVHPKINGFSSNYDDYEPDDYDYDNTGDADDFEDGDED